jgi:dTDP-4-amino-4,6-dideoxygalactose transaminase
MAALEAFARPRSLLVIEDAAHAHGATYCGHRAGSFGAAAAFSFSPTKNLGALGDGGAVCTDDDVLALRLRSLRDLGQRSGLDHGVVGYNERLDALQAAILREKLPYLDGWNEARRELARQYREQLPAEVRPLEERPESPSNYHLFPIRVGDRDGVIKAISERLIESRIHYPSGVHEHPAWGGQPLAQADVAAAEAWAAEEVSLPMHPDLTPQEVDRVLGAVHGSVSAKPRAKRPRLAWSDERPKPRQLALVK